MSLPDPRRYGGGPPNDLARLAGREDAAEALAGAVAACIAARRDDEIRQAYGAAGSRAEYLRLHDAVCAALDAPPPDAQIVTRVFAVPWVIVCAARAPVTIPCVLHDTAALVALLESRGALGLNRNAGFSASLCSPDDLERLQPATIRDWMTDPGAARECAPAPIRVVPGNEAVHLRFLLGAAIAPVHEPGVVETAANIGLWGMQATRAMSAQLAVAGADILPLPRPPASLARAPYSGRRAALEAALDLFLSNTVRRFRLKIGDPAMFVSAHEGSEVRVTLRSLLDEGMTEAYRWPLHPLDDLDDIESAISGFAGGCRLSSVQIVGEVLPDRTSTGALCLPGFDAASRTPPQH